MKYQNIIPATGWFYCGVGREGDGPIVFPLAVWAQTEDGVIGLISVPGGGNEDTIQGKTCRLIPVPPLRGVYKAESELTADELAASKRSA